MCLAVVWHKQHTVQWPCVHIQLLLLGTGKRTWCEISRSRPSASGSIVAWLSSDEEDFKGLTAVLQLNENHAQVIRMSPKAWLTVVGIYMGFQPRITGFSTQKSEHLHFQGEGKPQCGSVRKESKRKKEMWIGRLKLQRRKCWLPGRSWVPHLLKGGGCYLLLLITGWFYLILVLNCKLTEYEAQHYKHCGFTLLAVRSKDQAVKFWAHPVLLYAWLQHASSILKVLF